MKDRFVLPMFRSEYSDLLQGKDDHLVIALTNMVVSSDKSDKCQCSDKVNQVTCQHAVTVTGG